MVLEETIPSFWQWIGGALVGYLFAASLLAVVAGAAAWLVQSVIHGPLQAGDRVYRAILSGIGDLAGMSPRRIWALARLAIQESLRRKVLVLVRNRQGTPLPLSVFTASTAPWIGAPST